MGKAISHAKVGELKPQYLIQGVTYRSAEYARTEVDLGNWVDIAIGDSLRRPPGRRPTKLPSSIRAGRCASPSLMLGRVGRRQPLAVRAEAR